MDIQKLLQGSITDIKTQLLKEPSSDIIRSQEEWAKQYDGEHKILDRPNKNVGSPAETYDDGTEKSDTRKTIITNKLPITKQKQIVRLATAFCVGGGVNIKLSNDNKEELQDAFQLFLKAIKRVKMDNFNYKLVKTLCKESKAAELWHIKTVEGIDGLKKELKVYLLSYENGDEFYPHFNNYGDMDAFIRKYVIKNDNGENVEKVVIYTAEKIVTIIGKEKTEAENPFGKIPVIYYDQLKPEWIDAQPLIERMETVLSKFSDTNDYFASPAVKSKGQVVSPPNKEDVGKWFEIEGEETPNGIEYGDVEYLVWKHSPEAVKFEVKTLMQFINNTTSTPDISFANMKEMNGNISGVALKMLFLDSTLKAIDKRQTVIDEGFQRRMNLLKTMLSIMLSNQADNIMALQIKLDYGSILPQNVKEIIDNISNSRPAENLISKKTAIQAHPFVENVLNEINNINDEEQEVGASFNL